MMTVTPVMILILACSQAQLYLCSVFGQENKSADDSTRTGSTVALLPCTNEPDSKHGRGRDSACFETPFGDLVPFRAESSAWDGSAATEGDWFKGWLRTSLPLASGRA